MRRRRPKQFYNDPKKHVGLRRRWRSWLPAINRDLTDLLGKREIFWKLQEIAQENSDVLKHGALFDWMCRNYIAAVVMSVRGFVDERSDVQSLWRILYEVLQHPGVINRRAHCALYRGTSVMALDMGNRTFNSVVGRNTVALSRSDIQKDLRALEDVSARIKVFANMRIAHRAPARELRRHPRFNELDAAMDTIDRIFCKYNLLLAASGMSSAFATRQYNWLEVLYEPWIKPGSKFRPARA